MKYKLVCLLLVFITYASNALSGELLDRYQKNIKKEEKELSKNINRLRDVQTKLDKAFINGKSTYGELPVYLKTFKELESAELIIYYEGELLTEISWMGDESWLPFKYMESKKRWNIMRGKLVNKIEALETIYIKFKNKSVIIFVEQGVNIINESVGIIDGMYNKFYDLLPVKEIIQKLPNGKILRHKVER